MWKKLGDVMYKRDGDNYVAIYEGMRFRIYGNLKKALRYLSECDLFDLSTTREHTVGFTNGEADAVIVQE